MYKIFSLIKEDTPSVHKKVSKVLGRNPLYIFMLVFTYINYLKTFYLTQKMTTTDSRCLTRVHGIVLSMLLVLLIHVALSSASSNLRTRNSRIKICLNNCSECKRLYDEYFHGRRCADACLTHKGRFIPDCHDHYSIAEFITKLE